MLEIKLTEKQIKKLSKFAIRGEYGWGLIAQPMVDRGVMYVTYIKPELFEKVGKLLKRYNKRRP